MDILIAVVCLQEGSHHAISTRSERRLCRCKPEYLRSRSGDVEPAWIIQRDGYTIKAAKLTLQLNSFYNTVNNFIAGVAVAFDPIFTTENQNVGKIRSRGMELIGTVGPCSNVSLNFGSTYTDAQVTEN